MAASDTNDLLVLRRKPRISGWLSLGWRLAIMAGLLGALILIHWIERDGLKDSKDGVVSFLDVIYFTMISATTTGYGDIVPVTDRTRMFDALVVTPIRILFILILAGSAYSFVARRSWERFVMKRIQQSLKNHIIVAGYGTKNRRAVQELIDLGAAPGSIVVIDTNEARLALAKELGCIVFNADAARDETLRAVHVERAKLVIISAGRDDTSILICLTARHLAPDVRISIAVNEEDNEQPARRAGADVVVNPLDFAGLLLATTHAGHHIADYLADLASMKGKVRIVERDVRPEEIGKALKDITNGLGLRIIRDETPYGFWRPQVQSLEAGDVIMEICPTGK
ncbi:potassium channel family protein [Sphingomonas daechungensis]|uniref:NAD-binding protein n=1 Tax=Sphingomonas daechungensis TaxID=1176646 RepID=A0ABX6T2A6_9SPHN|nr:potassium channel family protein [Sphingomonas daechungensis]QNP43559.1 NAD-binding protein [Sphingomonas daechungensis]